MEEEITGETSHGGERQHTAAMTDGRTKKSLKVMVAVDDSDASLYAINWTVQNLFKNPATASVSAAAGGGGEIPEAVEPDPEQGMVTVVHVVQPFERYMFPAEPSMYTSAAMVESVRKAQQQTASQLLSRALQICKQSKIKAETLILEGDPKEMICQAVDEMHFDLLVVGSRGLGAIQRAFLGSISDFCAHHARCPILIVKPPRK